MPVQLMASGHPQKDLPVWLLGLSMTQGDCSGCWCAAHISPSEPRHSFLQLLEVLPVNGWQPSPPPGAVLSQRGTSVPEWCLLVWNNKGLPPSLPRSRSFPCGCGPTFPSTPSYFPHSLTQGLFLRALLSRTPARKSRVSESVPWETWERNTLGQKIHPHVWLHLSGGKDSFFLIGTKMPFYDLAVAWPSLRAKPGVQPSTGKALTQTWGGNRALQPSDLGDSRGEYICGKKPTSSWRLIPAD